MIKIFRKWLPLYCLILALTGTQPVWGIDNPENLYHWAYSSAFGTGFYRIGDDNVFVFRVSPNIELGKIANEKVAVNLRLPFTAGIQSLDLDIDEISNTISTFSFVPGLQLEVPVNDRWMLKPFGHYGWGWDFSGAERAEIYYYGINSRFGLRTDENFGLDLLNGLQWYGYNTNHAQSDRFTRLVTGLEANWLIPNFTIHDQELYLKPHILHFWYFDNIGFKQFQEAPLELKQEIEFGLGLGTKAPFSFLIFEFDRIGIAYRIGNESQGIRFFLSSVFD